MTEPNLDHRVSMEKQENLGPYQLLRVVANDAMGTVHEARDPAQDLRLAVRMLPANAMSHTPEAQERLRAGALKAEQLEHPNIIALHDGGWDGTTPYIATAWVEGESLAHYLARVGRLPALQGLALASQMLSALAHAHARGLVHGAINPHHLLVTRTGQLMVQGFGWVAPVAATATQPGVFDAPDYLAPEQLVGLSGDPRADLYSAAVVAYELLTGALPFQASDPGAAPPPVRAARPELPAELDQVFERALAQDPAVRFDSPAELSAALEAALGPPIWERPSVPALAPITEEPHPVEPPAVASAMPAENEVDTPSTPKPLPSRRWRKWIGLSVTAATAAAVVALGSLVHVEMDSAAPPATVASLAPELPLENRAVNAAREQVRPQAAALPALPAPAVEPARELTRPQPEPTPKREAARPAQTAMADADDAPEREVAPRKDVRPAAARLAEPRRVARRSERHVPRTLQASVPNLDCRPDPGLARDICITLRCTRPEFQKHPACMRLFTARREREQLVRALGGS